MEKEYKSPIFEIKEKSNILKYDNNIKSSIYIRNEQINLGNNSFLIQSKLKLKLLDDERIKKNKIYLIINNFNDTIPDYENDLQKYSMKYFNTDIKLTYSFYEYWEIISIFNIMDKDNISIDINDNTNDFTKALIFYKNKFNKSDNDIFRIITNKEFKDIKDKRYFEYNIKENFDNFEFRNIDDIMNIISKYKKKINILNCNNYNKLLINKEQHYYKTFIGFILLSLNILKNNGSFICKIYDIYTDVTVKIISILSNFYENVYIYKPYTTYKFTPDKYIICKKLKIDSTFEKNRNKIETLFKNIKKDYVYDIFTEFNISPELFNNIKKINIYYSNNEFVENNKIITYINNKEYFGEEYHEYKEEQINATKFWLKKFYK